MRRLPPYQRQIPRWYIDAARCLRRGAQAGDAPLARHQEEVEKREHPLNRIMSIEEDAESITIATTDIHLPRRIGETVRRAFHGKLDAHFEEDGYFVRVNWTPAA